MQKAAILLAFGSSWIVACAMGGSTSSHQGNADAPAQSIDAPGGPHDAHAAGDGPVTPHDAHALDAFVPQDAAHHYGSAGDVCLVNTDCDANMGLCCYLFSCASGTGIGSNLCFPN